MNANELADLIGLCGDGGYNQDAATMLRQQQALINQREDEIKAFYNLVAEQDKKIIDLAFEKVYAERSAAAMLRAQADLIDCLRMGQPNIDYDKELLKPPFVGRELTDNEIVWLWCDCEKDGTEATYIKFAKAILRKAQEK